MAKKTTKVSNAVSVTLLLGGKKHTIKAKTVSDALGGFELRNSKGKAIITVSKGDTEKSKIIMPFMVNRLLTGHGMMKEIAIKQISSLFDGI